MEVTIGWVSVWSTDFNFHNLGQEATKSDLSTPQQIDLTIINPKIFLKMVLLIHHTFHSLSLKSPNGYSFHRKTKETSRSQGQFLHFEFLFLDLLHSRQKSLIDQFDSIIDLLCLYTDKW